MRGVHIQSERGAQTLAADAVVVALGVDSAALLAPLGVKVPLYPVKGYSITVCLDDEKSRQGAPWVSLLDDRAKIVTSRLGADRFRVAGTAEINGFNRDIRADRIAPLVAWTRELFPELSTATAFTDVVPMSIPTVTGSDGIAMEGHYE